jgi:hypothetical protein
MPVVTQLTATPAEQAHASHLRRNERTTRTVQSTWNEGSAATGG